MSEGMFTGRTFSIPYSTASDQHTASMARAQIITRTSSPGTVIQVGDTVMAYGVTQQQARMGDLDVRLRSVDQLSSIAQDVVRRNIQWQYGEQVQESTTPPDPALQKSWITRLLGVSHMVGTDNPDLYPPVPQRRERELRPPTLIPTRQKLKPQPRPKVTRAKPKAAVPVPTRHKDPGVGINVRQQEAAAEDQARGGEALQDMQAWSAAGSSHATPQLAQHLTTAFNQLNHRHKTLAPEGWVVTREQSPDGLMRASIATGPSGEVDRHEVHIDMTSNSLVHRHYRPGAADPGEASFPLTPPTKGARGGVENTFASPGFNRHLANYNY
jgi:hypothetical protein